MFDSLRNLVNVPFKIKAYASQSGTGAKQHAAPIDAYCLPEANIVVIRNKLGKEITSATQLYIDGKTTVSELDLVIFEGREWPIEKINTFYLDGVPDIKVVYL